MTERIDISLIILIYINKNLVEYLDPNLHPQPQPQPQPPTKRGRPNKQSTLTPENKNCK